MNLDTLTLAPPQKPEPQNPIEQAAQQIIEHITHITTNNTARHQQEAHEANIRADNAEREYTRACNIIEPLIAENTTLKAENAELRTYITSTLPTPDETAPEMGDATTPLDA